MTTEQTTGRDAVAAIDAVLAETAHPQPHSFAAYMTAVERDQLDARAATAEAERDEALATLTDVWHALNAGGATGPATAADHITRLAAARDAAQVDAAQWGARAAQHAEQRDSLQRDLNGAGAELRSALRANRELTAERDNLAQALEHAESVRIDRDDSVWSPRPDGRWYTRYLDPMTLNEIENAFGPTRAGLFIALDDEQDEEQDDAPVPAGPAQEPIRPADWEQQAVGAVQAALADAWGHLAEDPVHTEQIAITAVRAIIDAGLAGPGGRCRQCGATYPRTLPAGQDPLCWTCDTGDQSGPDQPAQESHDAAQEQHSAPQTTEG
ncbi:hypothetical protein EYA84_02170 [Verrucosispora sp. SN26_14.1]|uniref:hypothetical protein n=1 Tax=Verrucosispora sp. SN26_14.1 TaxID=2527879 RepID=UPI0010330FDD|nr:hypothetical protein [Verrucosispora sp. SN26_14.1]TBL44270.1 hypothetical protein EYA84_02170 [Verrucosispora sp. SN26_14.1]